METRIFRDLYSSVSMDDYDSFFLEKLGEAKMNEGKLARSGIVTSKTLETLSPGDAHGARMNDICESFSTFERARGGWYAFNYFSKKEQKHKTPQGTLYNIGLFPYEEREPYDSSALMTACINRKRGIVCLVVNAGRASRKKLEGIASQIASAMGAEGSPSLLKFEEEQMNRLASVYLRNNDSISSSSVDVGAGKITIKHMRNIFSLQEIRAAEKHLRVEEKIVSGEWNALAFHVRAHRYYLHLSKCRPSRLTVLPDTKNKMVRSTILSVMDHIVSQVGQIADFSTYQTKLS
jgi:hypothetical protein